MSLSAQQAAFSAMFAHLVLYAGQLGYQAVIAEVARTTEQQTLYVQQGKSSTLRSQHLKRLAGDLLLLKDGMYQKESTAYAALGAYWEGLDRHNVWGGRWARFPDGNHFEYQE